MAAAGYAVVLLFGAAYAVAIHLGPGLPDRAAVTIGSLVAAPLALALLWPQLTGIKAFGFELSLSQFTVRIDTGLAAAFTEHEHQYYSGRAHILQQIERSIGRPEIELLEVDLHDGSYWAQTRLYLLAALADDYSGIRQFLFVEDLPPRSFVGFASPAAVRKALAAAFPFLEVAYLKIKMGHDDCAPAPNVAEIVDRWTKHAFDRNVFSRHGVKPDLAVEPDVVEKVDRRRLEEWLTRADPGLGRQWIEWRGYSEKEIVHAIMHDFTGPYVALLHSRSLDRVVNRLQLSTRIAERSIG